MDEEMHEVSGKSPDFQTELAKKLEELVPEAIADGKVDVTKIKELLAEDAGDVNERFGLFWPGKKRAMLAAQEPTTATLKPEPGLSKDWDTTENIFIEGDNLEVLKVLQRQYHNQIKMIYIDPPYNTGKDFVYPDNFVEGLQNYLEFSKQVDEGNKKISTNTETTGRYHSNWLNMMYPRLKLARNLLTDDGVILVSIDENEIAQLNKLIDEIFGENNFQSIVSWRRRSNQPNDDTKMIATVSEYIIVYSRDSKMITDANSSFGRLSLSEERLGSYTNPDNDSRGAWSSTPWFASRGQGGSTYSIKTPTGVEYSGVWLGTKDTFDKLSKDNRIIFPNNGNGKPRKKIFASERIAKGQTAINFWAGPQYGDNLSATNEIKQLFPEYDRIFDYPKPIDLIKTMIRIAAPGKQGLILDFFSGSSTTAHAVMQLNSEDGGDRKHIQVQLPEPVSEDSEAYKAGYRKISDIARERINRAGEKIKADFADKLVAREKPLDVGYRTYKLADTNFTKWRSTAASDLGELQSRLDLMRESSNDNATEDDLLTEIMLKLGLPLKTRTSADEVAGLRVYKASVSDESIGHPVFYLNEKIKPTLEQLRTVVTEIAPSKFVILEDAFQGDNELKTNLVQTCKSYDVELWTV